MIRTRFALTLTALPVLALVACSAGPGDDGTATGDATGTATGAATGTATGGDGDFDIGGDDSPEPVEDGEIPTDCDSILELTIRDFTADHPDMNAFSGGGDDRACYYVLPDLDVSGGKRQPAFNPGTIGQRRIEDGRVVCWIDPNYTPPSEITSADSFSQWYNNTEGVNMMLEHSLPLTETGTGTFAFDSGTAGFFPINGLGWNEEAGNNFYFTTEAHVRFTYQRGQEFTFSGDDDLWIFVNNKLALDLGGMHMELTATIFFDEMADYLGINPGKTYNMDIFHAERYKDASNFRVETNIGCLETVDVVVK